jgi:hypothetical protein
MNVERMPDDRLTHFYENIRQQVEADINLRRHPMRAWRGQGGSQSERGTPKIFRVPLTTAFLFLERNKSLDSTKAVTAG